MDSKATAETTAPSVAPAKPEPKPKADGEPEPDNPVPSMHSSGLKNDCFGSLKAAFSGLHVGTSEGKAKEKEKEEERAEDDLEGQQERPEDISSWEKPSEGAPGAPEHPTATTIIATDSTALSPTTTPSLAEGIDFTGLPYPTHGPEPLANEPPMAHPVSESLAVGYSYIGFHERTPCQEADAFCAAATSVCPAKMLAYTMTEHVSTFLRGPECF